MGSLKPEKLRVKGLAKNAHSRSLNQQGDHEDEHELNTPTQQFAQAHFQKELASVGAENSNEAPNDPNEDKAPENQATIKGKVIDVKVSLDEIDSENASLTKAQIIQNKPLKEEAKASENKGVQDKPSEQLDIFV